MFQKKEKARQAGIINDPFSLSIAVFQALDFFPSIDFFRVVLHCCLQLFYHYRLFWTFRKLLSISLYAYDFHEAS
jgi:hypothetical protein